MSTTTAAGKGTATGEAPIPRQIPYIIGNEGCERFSFYGMRNILSRMALRLATRKNKAGRISEVGGKRIRA